MYYRSSTEKDERKSETNLSEKGLQLKRTF